MTIEYVESLLPPNVLSGYQHDDWISCVKVSKGPIITGSYDNQIRVWDRSHNCVMTIKSHELPLKDIVWLNEQPQNMRSSFEIASSSDDKTVKIWKVDPVSKTFENTIEIQHEATVNTIDTNYDGARVRKKKRRKEKKKK